MSNNVIEPSKSAFEDKNFCHFLINLPYSIITTALKQKFLENEIIHQTPEKCYFGKIVIFEFWRFYLIRYGRPHTFPLFSTTFFG